MTLDRGATRAALMKILTGLRKTDDLMSVSSRILAVISKIDDGLLDEVQDRATSDDDELP